MIDYKDKYKRLEKQYKQLEEIHIKALNFYVEMIEALKLLKSPDDKQNTSS